jgi:hypothetical protein
MRKVNIDNKKDIASVTELRLFASDIAKKTVFHISKDKRGRIYFAFSSKEHKVLVAVK